MLDLGVQEGFVDKAGAWYSYNGERIGQGKDNVRQHLKEHPEICKELDRVLRERFLDAQHRPAAKVVDDEVLELPDEV